VGAPKLFEQAGIDTITVTDTVAIDELGLPEEHRARITTIESAPLFADAIREMQDG
jgi:phosphoribosylpyrophosphate synthetase